MRPRDYADDIAEKFFEKVDAAFASGSTSEIEKALREVAKAGAKAGAQSCEKTATQIANASRMFTDPCSRACRAESLRIAKAIRGLPVFTGN